MKVQRNYFAVLYNICTVAVAGMIAILIYNRQLVANDYGKAVFLIALFGEIFVLTNGAGNFYDVTLFVYLDRHFKLLTKSFIVATISVECFIFATLQPQNLFVFSIVFCLVDYILTIIGLIPGIWLQQMTRCQNAARTAFVGSFNEFRKANYFINKNSVRINQRGYILKNIKDDDGTYHVLGLLENLEDIIDENKLQMLYFIQKIDTKQKSIEPERELQPYIDICKRKGVIVKILIDSEALAFTGNISAIGTYPEITIKP